MDNLPNSQTPPEAAPLAVPIQRSPRWPWLCLAIVLPFLALNGLAAWQVRSLTRYSRPAPADWQPLQYQSGLKRWQAFALGVSIPRPENDFSPSDLGLEFATHTIDLGEGEQLEAWYVTAEAPAAPDPAPAEKSEKAETDAAIALPSSGSYTTQPGIVVLFPAYAASKQTLLQEVKLLHRLGYSTFAVDYRGVGGSSGSNTTLGPREAEDVTAALGYVRQTFGDRPLAVYSRLLGTGPVLNAIAQAARSGQPQPDAIILENPYDQLINLTRSAVEAVGLPRSPTAQILTFWGGVMLGGEATARDPVIQASAISSPTLVLHGADESWVTLDQVVGVFQQLPGPKEIAGFSSDRSTPLSATAPGLWMGKVSDFLALHLAP